MRVPAGQAGSVDENVYICTEQRKGGLSILFDFPGAVAAATFPRSPANHLRQTRAPSTTGSLHYHSIVSSCRVLFASHMRRGMRASAGLTGIAAVALALLGATACQDAAPPDPKLGSLSSGPDSLATVAEIRASLAGEHAPGAEAYSYRGLYAGIPKTQLDAKLLAPATATASASASASAGDSAACTPSASPKTAGELLCTHPVLLGEDRAPVRLDIVYTSPSATGVRIARELTVTRELPLDVDGVRVAAALADAFEQQTTLLDTRDATYGRHAAHIRMGTLNGARAHFAEVTVIAHAGREELTVRMGRGAGR